MASSRNESALRNCLITDYYLGANGYQVVKADGVCIDLDGISPDPLRYFCPIYEHRNEISGWSFRKLVALSPATQLVCYVQISVCGVADTEYGSCAHSHLYRHVPIPYPLRTTIIVTGNIHNGVKQWSWDLALEKV